MAQAKQTKAAETGAKGGPKRTYKRSVKNIIIHKPMQREFSFVLIALLMISTLAIGFIIHSTINNAVFGGAAYRVGKVSPIEILSDVSYQLIIRISCVLFVTLIVVASFGMLFLHRVAGPVYRFRVTFQAINKGELPRAIKLREGDFFTETAKEINKTIQRLEYEQERRKKIGNLLEKGTAASKVTEIKKVLAEEFKVPAKEKAKAE